MTLKPSTAFSGILLTATFASGAADADSLPTAALYRNGVLDAGVTVTVANLATGIYKLTGTLGAYSAGDEVQLRATAVMGGLTFHETIWTAAIDSSLPSDVATSIAALNDFDPANDVVARVTLVDTTTANTDMRGTDGANTTPPPAAATIAAQVRTELTAEIGRLDVSVSTRNATPPDNAGIAAIQAKTDNLPASPAATGEIPTAAAIADAVWDEDLGGHAVEDSAGDVLNKLNITPAGVPVDPIPAPSAPSLCSVVADVIDGEGQPAQGVKFVCKLLPVAAAKSDAGTIIETTPVVKLSAANGRMTVELPRNDLATPAGTQWRITSAACRFDKTVSLAAATHNLGTLIT